MSGPAMGAMFVILLYLALTLSIGIYSGRQSAKSSEGYFLASRELGPYVMFFTLFATNISAFAYMGAPGGAYHLGVGFFGYLATTTSLAAVFFYVIGYRTWLLGSKYGYMTAPQLIGKIYNSKGVTMVMLLALSVFTIAYMLCQPIGAGYVINAVTGGAVPAYVGVLMVLVFITIYVFWGGLKATAYADLLQGSIMMICVMLALILVTLKLGGPSAAAQSLMTANPELFARGNFSIEQWISFGLVIGLGVPVFPQLFTKYLAAKSSDSLKTTMTLYPLAMILIYIPVLFLGAFGNIVFPGLEGKASDAIIPMLLENYYAPWIGALVLSAVIAAIMSTIASQLITTSTMLLKDLYIPYINKNLSPQREVFVGRVFIFSLALLTCYIALSPPAAILTIVTWAFTGYAVCTPAILAALYWRRSTAAAIICSVLAGEGVLVLFMLGIIPASVLGNWQACVPAITISTLVLIVVSYLTKSGEEERRSIDEKHDFLDTIFKAENA
ncbi:sodium:solute symporter family protein [Pelotomaculum terephthalicicum JT]|uniref:sodium:solute symporter family protein n=2 Tax=Pelotomaculum TaxID=191373 RepID=UPI0009CC0E9A|nr:sodium:solute symporter family protein [Pelotomaculum terephthalicicum]MCG9969840.1 sodium:solute symporter family protein [Pelotomaculum terephthalicicum JT]OPY63124.1 MAG: Sodium/pantothenate symporter [Pelotomaculum sp. PtaU1.Bin065]